MSQSFHEMTTTVPFILTTGTRDAHRLAPSMVDLDLGPMTESRDSEPQGWRCRACIRATRERYGDK